MKDQPEFAITKEIEPRLAEMIECVEREIRYRQHVYPRRVAAKTMSQAMADQQIRLMEAIKRNLQKQA
jgi:hypothetical protein